MSFMLCTFFFKVLMDQKGESRSKIPKNIKTKNLQATLTWPRACAFL